MPWRPFTSPMQLKSCRTWEAVVPIWAASSREEMLVMPSACRERR